MDILQEILNIDPSKTCIRFLVDRIQSINYRGVQISQHNRYAQNEIVTILQEIHAICGIDLLQIRTTDLSKRPFNIEGEEKYAQLTHNIAKRIGRCTQDSLRKNIFVDMHRMGLIYRFNGKKELMKSLDGGTKKYISLTPLALELLESKDMFIQNLLYTRSLESLMNGFGEDILQLMLELDIKYLSIHEILFFVTFLYQKLDSKMYDRDDVGVFIKEFRLLSKFSHKNLIEKIKFYCNPNNFDGDKTQKRDFHNWINETQQIISLLSQMVYFDWNKKEERLYLRINKESLYEDDKKLKRSLLQKQTYFQEHGVEKTKGFELHHVVPLCWAKNRNEFSILDKWQNLVYIDAFSHAQITQNNNANVKLSFDNEQAIFEDFDKQQVRCKKQENILYDTEKEGLMLEYNRKLLSATNYEG